MSKCIRISLTCQYHDLAIRVADGQVSIRQALRKVPQKRAFKALVASLLRRRASLPSVPVRRWAEGRLCQFTRRWLVLGRDSEEGVRFIHVPLACRSSWCGQCGRRRQARAWALLEEAFRSGSWVLLTLTYPASDPPGLPVDEARALEAAVGGEVDEETLLLRARVIWMSRAWRTFVGELQRRWIREARRRGVGDPVPRLAYVAVPEFRPRLSGALKGQWVPHLHVAIRVEFLDVYWIRGVWVGLGGGPVLWIERVRARGSWSPRRAAAYLAGYLAGGKIRFGKGEGEIPEWDRLRLAAALRGYRTWMASRCVGVLWPRGEPSGWILLRIEVEPGVRRPSLDPDNNNNAQGLARVSQAHRPRDPPGGLPPGGSWLWELADPLLVYAVANLGAVADPE